MKKGWILKDHHKVIFPKVKKEISLCKTCVESCYLTRIVTKCKEYWERSK
jgi:hypothetical protein